MCGVATSDASSRLRLPLLTDADTLAPQHGRDSQSVEEVRVRSDPSEPATGFPKHASRR
jgi:hypothetical protein